MPEMLNFQRVCKLHANGYTMNLFNNPSVGAFDLIFWQKESDDLLIPVVMRVPYKQIVDITDDRQLYKVWMEKKNNETVTIIRRLLNKKVMSNVSQTKTA